MEPDASNELGSAPLEHQPAPGSDRWFGAPTSRGLLSVGWAFFFLLCCLAAFAFAALFTAAVFMGSGMGLALGAGYFFFLGAYGTRAWLVRAGEAMSAWRVFRPSAEGLEVRGPMRRTVLSWQDLKKLEGNSLSGYHLTTTKGRRLAFHPKMVDAWQLVEAILLHAPHLAFAYRLDGGRARVVVPVKQ